MTTHSSARSRAQPLSVISLLFAMIVGGALDSKTVASAQSEPAGVQTFTLGVTGNLSNLPWIIGQRRGALDRLERKHGVRLDILRFAGEDDAIEAFARGHVDAVTSSFPAMIESVHRSQRNADLILLTGISRGGYGVVSRSITNPNALRNQPIHLALGSSSHYLLFRILERANMELVDVDLINRPERVLTRSIARGEVDTAVVGGMSLANLAGMEELTLISDSRSLGGELINGTIIDSAVARENPSIGRMLTEAWFSIMASLDDGNGGISVQARDAVMQLSGLPAGALANYLSFVDFLTQPNQVKNLMTRENLRLVTAAVARFRSAAKLYACPKVTTENCVVFRSDRVIATIDGVELRLNPSFIQALIDAAHDDAS